MPFATSARSRTVRMFLARPRFFWNSLKRRSPIMASRMISIDQQSPIASIDRAIGHSAFSKRVRFAIAVLQPLKNKSTSRAVRGCIMKPPALNSNLVSKCNQIEIASQPENTHETRKQDGFDYRRQQRHWAGDSAAVRGGGGGGRHPRPPSRPDP